MKKLLENTLMLYCMKFAGYFFSLVIIPYQTRVLSQEYFGGLSLAIGVMLYYQIFIDFGFMVSGVADVAENHGDGDKLNRILTSVTLIRLVLAVISLPGLWILFALIDNYAVWSDAFYIYFLAVVAESLLPTFFFRGMEDMRTIALLTVGSKALSTAIIFLTVRNDADYLIIPWCRVLGAAVSLVLAVIYIRRRYHNRLVRISFAQLRADVYKSGGYFLSRVAGSIYRGGNITILGGIFCPATVALYSSAEKLVNIGMTMSSPIADSLLPHISRTKNYSSAWKLMMLMAPVLAVGAIAGFIFAEQIMALLFGPEYAAAAPILRIMVLIIVVTLPNYIIAFPVLVPMGLGRQSNIANIIGAIVYCCGTLICYITGVLSIFTAAVILLLTELSVAVWRICVLLRYRERLRHDVKERPD